MVNTSVRDDHLRVLWGEIGRFVNTARYPLRSEKGGHFICNHRDYKRRDMLTGEVCSISYMKGIVSETEEGLSGHHAYHTLALADEASAVTDKAYSAMQGWASGIPRSAPGGQLQQKRMLFIGNPNQGNAGCSFFQAAVEAGDVEATLRV